MFLLLMLYSILEWLFAIKEKHSEIFIKLNNNLMLFHVYFGIHWLGSFLVAVVVFLNYIVILPESLHHLNITHSFIHSFIYSTKKI